MCVYLYIYLLNICTKFQRYVENKINKLRKGGEHDESGYDEDDDGMRVNTVMMRIMQMVKRVVMMKGN